MFLKEVIESVKINPLNFSFGNTEFEILKLLYCQQIPILLAAEYLTDIQMGKTITLPKVVLRK
ncbi:hypothetical protein M0Q39_06700 [Patescibacteria group bacterium]|nr:hypothetical protein [Patescibacteria group bacterium]